MLGLGMNNESFHFTLYILCSLGAVVALINKAMEGDRSLKDSVLFNHEVPTIGTAAWGLDSFWSPQFLLIDLKGTCSQTGPALRRQLFQSLPIWAKEKQDQHWAPRDFARRSRLQWACLDCKEEKGCHLDQKLANYVTRVVEA